VSLNEMSGVILYFLFSLSTLFLI